MRTATAGVVGVLVTETPRNVLPPPEEMALLMPLTAVSAELAESVSMVAVTSIEPATIDSVIAEASTLAAVAKLLL